MKLPRGGIMNMKIKCAYCTETFNAYADYQSHLNLKHPWRKSTQFALKEQEAEK